MASTMASTPTKQSTLAWSLRRGSTESLEDDKLEDENMPTKFTKETPFKKQKSASSPRVFQAFEDDIEAARQQNVREAQELVVRSARKYPGKSQVIQRKSQGKFEENHRVIDISGNDNKVSPPAGNFIIG